MKKVRLRPGATAPAQNAADKDSIPKKKGQQDKQIEQEDSSAIDQIEKDKTI